MTVFKLKTQKVVADMATSFVNEGYILQFKVESLALMFYKLHHRSNGKTIIVSARPTTNYYEITKNGKRTKWGQIIPGKTETVHQS